MLASLLSACVNEDLLLKENTKPIVDFVDTDVVNTPEKIETANTIQLVTRALRRIYKDRMVVEEVNAAIATGYYADETVLLKDLLDPMNSPIYKMESFNARKEARGFKVGLFKERFEEELGIGQTPVSRTNDLYFQDNGLSIYFPYHEDTQYMYPVTIVQATVEADQAWAYDPNAPEPDPTDPASLDPYSVLVDDNYASMSPTHMVGMGSETNYQTSDTNCSSLKVSIGKVKVLNGHQYDKLISFSSNGGGAEFIFIGAKAVAGPGQNYISTANYTQYKYVNRRAIKNGEWIDVWGTLDPSWQSKNTNQIFGIYEFDNTDNNDPAKYFTASLTYVDGYSSSTFVWIDIESKNDIVSHRVHTYSEMLYLANTYGQSAEYLSGFGPQYTSTDGYVRYSLPIACF